MLAMEFMYVFYVNTFIVLIKMFKLKSKLFINKNDVECPLLKAVDLHS